MTEGARGRRSDDRGPAGRWCVVGLGNPGPRYADNRHNVGAMVARVLAERHGGRFQVLRSRFARGLADVADLRIGGQVVTVAIPRSFMNESGTPVAAIRSYYRLDVGRLAVVHDDLDIQFGRLRLKLGGGEGGHNGLRSVSAALGTRDYYRVRFGIGRPPGRQDPADYVLRDFAAAERRELPPLLERAADAIEELMGNGLEAAQQRYNC